MIEYNIYDRYDTMHWLHTKYCLHYEGMTDLSQSIDWSEVYIFNSYSSFSFMMFNTVMLIIIEFKSKKNLRP